MMPIQCAHRCDWNSALVVVGEWVREVVLMMQTELRTQRKQLVWLDRCAVAAADTPAVELLGSFAEFDM
jgi:ABC-type transporter Mla MlaB component